MAAPVDCAAAGRASTDTTTPMSDTIRSRAAVVLTAAASVERRDVMDPLCG
jgi:hypothetical protein